MSRRVVLYLAAILFLLHATCRAAPVSLELRPEPPRMIADGKSVGIIKVIARDVSGRPVADGTSVQLTATLGQLADNSVTTTNGMATVEIVSAAVKGKGTITASIPGQAIASVQIAFVDEADASIEIPEYFSLDGGGYLAFSSDYKVIEAFSETEATFTGGQVSIKSLSWQYDTRSNGLVAHQAVMTRRSKAQNFYRLLYYPMSDSGIGLIQHDDGSVETVMLERRKPGQMKALIRFDEPLAHRIYSASDIFLMPSRFEPCGLGQLMALRYGTIPVVRTTGGLADTIVDYSPSTRIGNGFTFNDPTAEELQKTLLRAVQTYQNEPEVWKYLVHTALNSDFGWHRPAANYERLYRRALEVQQSKGV